MAVASCISSLPPSGAFKGSLQPFVRALGRNSKEAGWLWSHMTEKHSLLEDGKMDVPGLRILT